MIQRVIDLMRERRINAIKRRLVASANRSEQRELLEQFRVEILNRSPGQCQRMERRLGLSVSEKGETTECWSTGWFLSSVDR